MCFSTPFMRLLMQITNEISHNKSTTFDVNVGQCYCQCVKYYCSENAFLLSMASSLFVSTLIFDDYCIIVVNEKPIARYAFIIHLVNCLYLYLCVSVSLLLCACHFILFYFFMQKLVVAVQFIGSVDSHFGRIRITVKTCKFKCRVDDFSVQ